MSTRDSFIFYRSFFEALLELQDQDRLAIMDSILIYQFGGLTTELKGIPKTIFTLIRPQLDANNRRYENGRKGGRPPKKNQTVTEVKPRNNLDENKPKPNKNENVNKNDNENNTLLPPKGERVCKPDDVEQGTWNEWLKVRKAKRLAMTTKVIERTRNECAKIGWTLQRAIEECNANSWGGFTAEWVKENPEVKIVTSVYDPGTLRGFALYRDMKQAWDKPDHGGLTESQIAWMRKYEMEQT